MTTMQAMTVGPAQALTRSTVDRPVPGPTEVLVEVAAAGVNPIDWKTRRGGGVGQFFAPDRPMILGWDVAGRVVELGPGVTRFSVGDRVFGMPAFPHPAGAYAEYVVARSRHLAPAPAACSDVEAGGLPLAALTAWQALVDTLAVGAGDRVLIHAASGGVGHLALQIAKARGAEVWGTASAGSHDTLVALGLDHPIDYRAERFEDVATGMDAVLDLVGTGDNPTRSVRSLRPGGRLVVVPSAGGLPAQDVLDEAGVTATGILVEPDHAGLEQIARLVDDGALRVVIGETLPLAAIDELHTIGEAGGPLGKLVATMDR